ncbi:hypothetical protein [Lysinibacillus sp. C5.1]|uniref:hypothetical protein n=1 Tax=Lysinibacillus sp. C5.1 TaxID=2796169 RepID=UPI003081BF2B
MDNPIIWAIVFREILIHFVVLLTLLGLACFLMILFSEGLGIADESNRRNISPKLYFFSQLLWFGVLLLLSYKMILEEKMTWKKAFVYGSIFAAVMFLFLLMAYRTPLIIMLFTGIIIFHYVVKRVKLTWFLSALFVIAVAFSMFGFIRVLTEDTTKDFNKRNQPDVELTAEERKKLVTAEYKVNQTPLWMRR